MRGDRRLSDIEYSESRRMIDFLNAQVKGEDVGSRTVDLLDGTEAQKTVSLLQSPSLIFRHRRQTQDLDRNQNPKVLCPCK